MKTKRAKNVVKAGPGRYNSVTVLCAILTFDQAQDKITFKFSHFSVEKSFCEPGLPVG